MRRTTNLRHGRSAQKGIQGLGIVYENGDGPDEQGGWSPIPDWAAFFVDLGARLAEPTLQKRPVVAVSAPALEFGAAMTALGVVRARAANWGRRNGKAGHIKALKNLSTGHPVVFPSGGKKIDGVFRGIVSKRIGASSQNQEMISIQLVRGGTGTQYLPLAEAHTVIPKGTEEMQLPEKRPKSRPLVRQEAFLHALLETTKLFEYTSESRLDCVVVGGVGRVGYEIAEQRFGLRSRTKRSQDSIVFGVLQDVLRPRGQVKDGGGYRTRIYAADKKPDVEATAENDSVPVVFDGASGYMKWRTLWPRSPLVVILDRTERGFPLAVDTLNTGYIKRTDGSDILDGLQPIPAGLDVMAFQERC